MQAVTISLLLDIGKVYVPPKKLRKRNDVVIESRDIVPDQTATGLEMHKDFIFSNAWQKFKVFKFFLILIFKVKIRYYVEYF